MGADCRGFRRESRQRERQGRRKEAQAYPKEVREIFEHGGGEFVPAFSLPKIKRTARRGGLRCATLKGSLMTQFTLEHCFSPIFLCRETSM